MIFTALVRDSPDSIRKTAILVMGGSFEECRKKIFDVYGEDRVISIIYETSKNK